KFLVGLHAAATLVSRHVLGEAGDDRELKIFAARTIENHTMRVDEGEFGAVAEKGDGTARGGFDANAIRENGLHAGRLDQREIFEGAAAGVERNAQHTTIAIAGELLEDGFAADDAIAMKLDLIGLEQRDLRGIEEEFSGDARGSEEGDADSAENEHAAIEGP